MPAKPLTPEQLEDARRLSEAFAQWQNRQKARGASYSQTEAAYLLSEIGGNSIGQSALSQYLRGKIPLNAEMLATASIVFEVDAFAISPTLASETRDLAKKIEMRLGTRNEDEVDPDADFIREAERYDEIAAEKALELRLAQVNRLTKAHLRPATAALVDEIMEAESAGVSEETFEAITALLKSVRRSTGASFGTGD